MSASRAAKILAFAKKYQLAGLLAGFVIATLLGSGSFWSWLASRDASENTRINLLSLVEELRAKQLDIHGQITTAIPDYVLARDEALRSETENPMPYEKRNVLLASQERLIELINSYNLLEAEMSALEQSTPRFFDMQRVSPPMAPTIDKMEMSGTTLNIHVRKNEDPVRMGTREYLEQLLQERRRD